MRTKGEGVGLFERTRVHPENPDGAFSGQPTAVSQTYVMTFAECLPAFLMAGRAPIADS